MWPLQVKKLELEIKKLERENADHTKRSSQELSSMLRSPVVQSAVRELKRNPIKPHKLRIYVGRKLVGRSDVT